jgi:hypothetical protein
MFLEKQAMVVPKRGDMFDRGQEQAFRLGLPEVRLTLADIEGSQSFPAIHGRQ